MPARDYAPVILEGRPKQDDEILATRPPPDAATLPGGGGSEVIMELLQRFKVRDVMNRQVACVARAAPLREAQRVMRENRVSGVPVAENGRLYGIVSVNDIINALDGGWIDDPCETRMATSLVVLEAGMPLAYALRYFNNYTYGRFPVLDADRRLVGVISQRDVMRALLLELTVEVRKLERKVSDRQLERPSDKYLHREYAVIRNDLSHAGKAANEIRQILKDKKVDRALARRVAVAAYELEINICIHSHGGVLTFILADDKIIVQAKDRGPGIADTEWACRDGTSTANDWIRSMGFGAGMGLANSKRVSDTFDIMSKVPTGTTVMCGFKLRD